jgi:hypothetical protein
MLSFIFALALTLFIIYLLSLFNVGLWYTILTTVSIIFITTVYSLYSLKKSLSMIFFYFLIMGISITMIKSLNTKI